MGVRTQDDTNLNITISVDLLLPVPEESLESYLYYLETSVLDELGPRLRKTFVASLDSQRDDP